MHDVLGKKIRGGNWTRASIHEGQTLRPSLIVTGFATNPNLCEPLHPGRRASVTKRYQIRFSHLRVSSLNRVVFARAVNIPAITIRIVTGPQFYDFGNVAPIISEWWSDAKVFKTAGRIPAKFLAFTLRTPTSAVAVNVVP